MNRLIYRSSLLDKNRQPISCTSILSTGHQCIREAKHCIHGRYVCGLHYGVEIRKARGY